MIWLPQFLFKISPLKSLYSAGRASLAFLPSRWNILTSTAFLFPKTTTGSCSAYFNPEKKTSSHFRLALHYYEGTPLLPQFLSCMNSQTHCIQISLFCVQPWVFALGFTLMRVKEAGEESRMQTRYQTVLAILYAAESHTSRFLQEIRLWRV